ncbi:cysteine-rich PDZ-binding protein isoform X4 [Phoca vitulina]|uniref:cysteine-rich PDZ-binding protein isoform X4 n=1 Tax=Phoca vitulina TaxID=9720 RepID=UPI0013964150|nr:cysteine-rich PDZ-binding protein isoform X4 [Phoca vitulina]
MVCEKCEKKLGTVITPDTWKDGARNTTESGGRKLNENKALTSKKARELPLKVKRSWRRDHIREDTCPSAPSRGTLRTKRTGQGWARSYRR